MKKKDAKKIVLTGGHAATAALATIEAFLEDKDVQWELVWIGTKKAMEGSSTLTLEFRLFPQLGVRCVSIPSGRLQRRYSKYSLISLARIPLGFVAATWLLVKLRPHAILSFGGFAAFPVVVVGWILRIPVVIHEQTAAIGRANRFSVKFARVVALARESSKAYFHHSNVVVTGNPVSKVFTQSEGDKGNQIGEPVIYITGGSRGARRINDIVLAALPQLLDSYTVIHQTGEADFSQFEKLSVKFSPKKYKAVPIVTPSEMAGYMKGADLIISRAGANTVSELLVTKRPAILIPIPWAAYDEQTTNARLVVQSGRGVIISESELNKEKLLLTIKMLLKKRKETMRFPASPYAKTDTIAAKNLVDVVKKYAL